MDMFMNQPKLKQRRLPALIHLLPTVDTAPVAPNKGLP